MGIIINVDVNTLRYWESNYRFGTARNQKEAEKLLKKSKNFDDLVLSIKELGLLNNNLITISKDKQNEGFNLVYDGNRRLAAIRQLNIKKIQAYLEEDQVKLNAILQLEHTGHSAGRQKWTQIQQARYDKDRFEQKLDNKIKRNVVSLAIIEKTLNDHVKNDFPLTTFQRIINYEDIRKKLGIISSNELHKIKINKQGEIIKIIEDINDGSINSRNLNTKDNIILYIDRLLAGLNKEKRTDLKEDVSDDDISEDDNYSNRLFNKEELKNLNNHIKNKRFLDELEDASIKKYPHLLRLATRATLDTLSNEQGIVQPKSLHHDLVTKDLYPNEKNYTKKIINLIDSLGELAHNVNKQATEGHIYNDKDIVNKIIEVLLRRRKPNSKNS